MNRPVDPWRRFAKTLLLTAAGLVGGLYLFVIAVDPWGSLPLSLPLPRVPISSNARFAFPVLARSPRFDAAVFGTSTARLLRPVDLDPEFGARFVNLAMNSATAWEQSQMLGVFLRAHPHPGAILIDMDAAWCGESAERLTPRPFPDWMYQRNRWPGYAEMLTPYAVQEAFNLVLVLLHVKHSDYGTDGYTSFVPPDASYDPARVDAAFARWPPTNEQPTAPDAPQAFPSLPLLAQDLAAIPPGTRTVLFFPPAHTEQQGQPGSWTAVRWAACKRAVAGLAAGRATVLDMLIPSAITRDRGNFWDPLHYRVAVAGRVAALLGGAPGDEERVLAP